MNPIPLKQLFSKIAGSGFGQFVRQNAIPIATGAGGIALGAGAVGLGNALSNASDARQMATSQGYVGSDAAAPYVMSTYGVNPSSPTDIAQLPPEQFKQLILDSRHGGMYNPMSGKMIF